MKNVLIFFALIFWMVITLLLAISVVGLFVMAIGDNNDWFEIGKKLKEDLKLNY